MSPARPARRLLLPALAALWLAACASGPDIPPHYYQLRVEPPEALPAAGAAAEGLWQLVLPVRMPEYLERNVLWLPTGSSGLQQIEGHRWAEPLSEAVPRIVGNDLSLLRGPGRVWSGALPAGVQATRQLRLEVLSLEAAADRRSVLLNARWTLSDPQGQAPLQPGQARISVPAEGPAPDQLVAAHRLALWRLAQRLVAIDGR